MTTTAKIGAFFIVVLVLLGVLILNIEDIHFGKKARTNTAEVHFKDVAGLDDKSAVRIAGVRVGKVDGVRLLPDGTALVKLALDKNVELHPGAYGQIRSLGLLGDKYVEVFPGNVNQPKLPDGVRLEGNIPAGLEQLTQLASDIGNDLKEVSKSLAASMGGSRGEEKLNRIVDNLGRLAESMADLVDANRANIDTSLANIRELSASMRETLLRVDRILEENRANLKGTIANADEITAKLKTAADNLNSITEKIDTGKGTVGKLLNDDETHRNLNEALQSVKTGVESLNTTLSRVNRIQLDLGFRAEYFGRSADSKEFFTLDVIPRENKFYRLEVAALPHGRRHNTISTQTVTFPDGSNQTIQTQTESFDDELGLSLQLGYRLKNTILRGGLIESRGGLAVDQLLFSDRFQVSGEGWDFARPNYNGHVKVYGRWNPTPNLYVTGGLDELLNAPLRSIFFGAGLKWKDEDIKSLFGLAPLLK